MNIQIEHILPDTNSSFRLLRNPRLNDLFFWHFHPEYELVYIEGADGTRHVGDHISTYRGSDLVFIGKNIPHLNFDYGIKGNYEKIVLHIQASFKDKVLPQAPELASISQLFELSQHAIVFSETTKRIIGERLKKFHNLPKFEQLLEALRIFQILSESKDAVLLHEKVYINQYSKREQERIRRVYAYIDLNYQRKIELEEVATLCNLSRAAFCRYFKKMTGSTFVEFLNQYRISQAKKMLLLGKNVSESCYGCGFESLSYFNRTFKKITTENPSTFKNKYAV